MSIPNHDVARMGGHRPVSRRAAFRVRVRVPALCGMCSRSLPGFESLGDRVRPGSPLAAGRVPAEAFAQDPALARPAGRSEIRWRPAGARAGRAGDSGSGGSRLREGSTSGFCSLIVGRGRPPWPAWPASGAGLLALCLAWPWRGPQSLTAGPSLPSGTSEKN